MKFITFNHYGNMVWGPHHLLSLCMGGWWKPCGYIGIVVCTWGLRIGIGRDEVLVWFPWRVPA